MNQSKLATLRERAIETFSTPTLDAKQTEEATVKKVEIIETKPCSILLMNCETPVLSIETEPEQPIKHENPSNGGSFHIESVFIDAADEFPPPDCDKVTIKEEFSDSVGFEVHTNHDSDEAEDFEYKLEIKNNDKNHHDIVENNEIKPQPAKKRVRYSGRSEMSGQPKKPQEKISRRCPTCNKSFHHLLRHIVETHSDIERPFECFICHFRTYKRYEHLKYHMVRHGDIKNYICQHCGLSFYLNSDLRKHIFNRHSTDRPFACKTCRKCFKNRRGLTVHERTHENLKPFTCKICEAVSFSTLGALKIHERKHTGEKRMIQCSISYLLYIITRALITIFIIEWARVKIVRFQHCAV